MEQELINKMAEVIANLEDYSPVYIAQAALAAIQEDYVLEKKERHLALVEFYKNKEDNLNHWVNKKDIMG